MGTALNVFISNIKININSMKKKITLRKLAQNELIPPGAYHSLDDGKTIYPIVNQDTIGDIPSRFAHDRSFWVITNMENIEE